MTYNRPTHNLVQKHHKKYGDYGSLPATHTIIAKRTKVAYQHALATAQRINQIRLRLGNIPITI